MKKQPCELASCRKRHCGCGCRRHVTSTRARAKWATYDCIPSHIRAEAFRRGRKTFAYRARAKKFRAEVERLTSSRRRISHEDLLATFQNIYRRAYSSGFHAGKTAGERGDDDAIERARWRGAAA